MVPSPCTHLSHPDHSSTFFFSLFPQQLNDAGHGFIYQSQVERAVSPYVSSFQLFMHLRAVSSYASMRWIPFFDDRYKWHGAPYRSLLKPSKGQLGRRIFFLDGISILEGAHVWLAFKRYSVSSDELWIILRYDFDSLKLKGAIHEAIIRGLHQTLQDRLKLMTDSRLLQKDLQSRFDFPIHLLPIPHTEMPVVEELFSSLSPLRCYWPGPPRFEKGWETIRSVLHLKWLGEPIELVASQKASFHSSSIRVVELSPVLSHSQYWEEMLRCDVLLLPYAPSTYSYSTSGVFVEGVIAGKIPIVSRGTWLASELTRFGLDRLIVDWQNPFFWQQIVDLTQNGDILFKLSQMQQEYRSFHCFDTFQATLLSLMDDRCQK
jgi:hypothetical protein